MNKIIKLIESNIFMVILILVAIGYGTFLFKTSMTFKVNSPVCQSQQTLAEYASTAPWYGKLYFCEDFQPKYNKEEFR
jgi:hypothetical protein